MTNNTTLAVFAIVAALALVGIVVITAVIIPMQEAEARGCNNNDIAINAAKGRCLRP
jgi:hypothetical protein